MTSVEAYWAALQGAAPTPRSRSRAGPMLGWAAAALIVALAVAYGTMRLADWRPLTIVTGSMRPAYSPGDLIVVSPQRAAAVRPGEVITFAHPRVATHASLIAWSRCNRVRRSRPDGWRSPRRAMPTRRPSAGRSAPTGTSDACAHVPWVGSWPHRSALACRAASPWPR